MSVEGHKTEMTISNRTIARIAVVFIVSFLGYRFFSKIAHPLTLVFISFFLALSLNPAVGWVSKRLKSSSRIRATAIAYILVLVFLVTFFSTVVPPIARQTTDFVKSIPSVLENFKTQDSSLAQLARKYNLDKQISQLGDDIASKVTKLPGPVLSTAGRIGSIIISVLTVIVLTFMMLVEGPIWLERFWHFQKPSQREHGKRLAAQMYKVVTGYVNGQVLIAAIAASFALLALLVCNAIFGTSVNAVALAGIIALTGLIPMIGNMIGAALVVIVCLFSSVGLAITLAVFFLVYQQIENVTIQPYIQSKHNELTPLIVFIAALLGIGFGSLIGGFVAIPLAGCARVLLKDYLATKQNKKIA